MAPLDGKLSFKDLPDGLLNKTKGICMCCQCGLSYHRSLRYYLLAKHSADALSPPLLHQGQAALKRLQQRHLGNYKSKNFQQILLNKW